MACKNCFIYDEIKLHSKVGFFEKRKDLVLFLLNVVLNIKDLFMDHCKCDSESICQSRVMGEIFNEKVAQEIYKNCLDYDFLCKIKENLHLNICTLLNKKDHFLCKIINKKYNYYHKCMFTRTDIYVNVSVVVYSEWEKIKIKELVTNDAKVVASNFLKEDPFFKVFFFFRNG